MQRSQGKEYIVLVQNGPFYYASGEDAWILSHLCGYKIKFDDDGNENCGFPGKRD